MIGKEKDGLLDFFLKARSSIVDTLQRDLPLSDLRKIAENSFESRKHLPGRYLSDVLDASACSPIFEYVFDPDFLTPLGRIERSDVETSQAGACAVFLSPEQSILSLAQSSDVLWNGFLARVPAKTLCFRTGFLSSEFDVLETVALGFQGVFVHARHLDLYQIQLLTEICRDFRITFVAIADSAATVDRILESDCPYIGLWGYDVKTFAPKFSLLSKLASKVPSSCHCVGILPSQPVPALDVLRNLRLGACVL